MSELSSQHIPRTSLTNPTSMIQFFKTLIAGIKEGAIAAWYDLHDYFVMMAIILAIYFAVILIKRLLRKFRS